MNADHCREITTRIRLMAKGDLWTALKAAEHAARFNIGETRREHAEGSYKAMHRRQAEHNAFVVFLIREEMTRRESLEWGKP